MTTAERKVANRIAMFLVLAGVFVWFMVKQDDPTNPQPTEQVTQQEEPALNPEQQDFLILPDSPQAHEIMTERCQEMAKNYSLKGAMSQFLFNPQVQPH